MMTWNTTAALLANVALGLFGGLIENQIKDELNAAIEEALNAVLYEACDAETPCPHSDISFCDIDQGVCRFAGVIDPATDEPMKMLPKWVSKAKLHSTSFLPSS